MGSESEADQSYVELQTTGKLPSILASVLDLYSFIWSLMSAQTQNTLSYPWDLGVVGC